MNTRGDYDNEIYDLYVNEHLAMNKISDRLNISVGKVYNRIKEMKIDTRTISDYPATEKQIKHITELGKSMKGVVKSEETRKKISESKFKGGIGSKKIRSDGYVSIYFPEHPRATKEGRILEHVLVMECLIGRPLKDDEVVHHKNKIKSDNRAENLQLMTFKEHAAFHMKERINNRRNDLSIK